MQSNKYGLFNREEIKICRVQNDGFRNRFSALVGIITENIFRAEPRS